METAIRIKLGTSDKQIDRRCIWCGIEFTPNADGQGFCSPSHRHKYRHAKNKARPGDVHERCPNTFKISFATRADAMDFTVLSANRALNVYQCFCGSWHWGRHLSQRQRDARVEMSAKSGHPNE